MAVSEVAIANAALQKLGVSRKLESLTQDHPNARTMNLAYERIRDAELRRYDWGFSIRRASIAADGSQTVWGDWNRYSIPNDFMKLMRDDESNQATDWRIEGGAEGEGSFIITADASPLDIRYVAKVLDPNAFDSLFREAVACKMAHDTCKEVTGSTELKNSLMQDYTFAINEAKRIGAIEKPAQRFPEDPWVNARF
jgi:hypothetical protein